TRGGDQAGKRPDGVQSALAQKRRKNSALLPQREGGDAGRGNQGDGTAPTGQAADARRGRIHRRLPEDADGRDPGRLHQAAGAAEEHGQDAQAGQYLRAGRTPAAIGSDEGGRREQAGPQSSRLWNRNALETMITTPITPRVSNCGQSTLIPTPFKKIPRTMSMK